MIFVFITIGLFWIRIVLWAVHEKYDSVEIPLLVSTTLYFIFATVLLIVYTFTHIGTEKEIAENDIEYKALVKQVEIINSDYEDVSKSMVIQNVAEWNKKVYRNKYLVENPWTSWLCNKKVADNLEFIDM